MLGNLIRMELSFEVTHQKDKLVAAGEIEVLFEEIDTFRLSSEQHALLCLLPQDPKATTCFYKHCSFETGGSKSILWSMYITEFSVGLLTGGVDACNCTQRLIEVCQASSISMEAQRVLRSFNLSKEPWISFNLLGKVTVLSDCVNHDRVLLTLLLEEVAGCDLWQAQYIGKISMLVTSEFGDVTLGDLLQS